MRLVVDANILFAALIKDDKTIELMLDKDLMLYAPSFIFLEFEKYRNVILSKTSRTNAELDEVYSLLRKIITLVPLEESFINEAKSFSPDQEDVAYIALALQLNIPIWSNDGLLKKQLKVSVYNTSESLLSLSHS